MAIAVGQPAPNFTLHETLQQQRSLRDFRGRNVVLAFLPGACTTEMCALRDRLDGFRRP